MHIIYGKQKDVHLLKDMEKLKHLPFVYIHTFGGFASSNFWTLQELQLGDNLIVFSLRKENQRRILMLHVTLSHTNSTSLGSMPCDEDPDFDIVYKCLLFCC